MRLNGDAIDEADERGERVVGDTLLVIFNAGDDGEPFVLPRRRRREWWETLLDTADPWIRHEDCEQGDRYELQARSMAVLRLRR